jgi:hypothetical protein
MLDQLRARISEREPEPLPAADDGHQALIVSYKLANLGRSPAQIVQKGMDCVWVPLPAPSDLPAPRLEDVQRDPLGPGKRMRDGEFVVINKEQRDAMLLGKGALMLYGVIKYRDVFSEVREYGFAWLYHRMSLQIGEGTGWDDSPWFPLDGPAAYFRQT